MTKDGVARRGGTLARTAARAARRGCRALPLYAAVIASPAVLAAQDEDGGGGVTVQGEVLDNANGVPVAVAIVAIPALNRSAVTDELGYFRFEDIPPGHYPIRVMRLGYETLDAEVPINRREVLALHLTPGRWRSRGSRST